MEKICGIYCFINTINNKRYIGQSIDINSRYKSHLKHSQREKHKHCLLYRAFSKYGVDKFNFVILEECNKEDLNNRERYYISLYQSNNPEYGYNMTAGGDAFNIGHEPWNKGKHNVYSEDVIERNRQTHLGNHYRLNKKAPLETRLKISNSSKNRKLSKDTCKKMSLSRTGPGNPMYGKPGVNKGKHRIYNSDGTYHYSF